MQTQKLWARVVAYSCFFAGVALAQVTTGTISGTVKDSSGAVVPGSTVTVKNVDTQAARKVITDAAGAYRASQLPLGNYEITAESQGFHKAVRSGVVLTVGREAVVDFALEVGAVTQAVTVTGEAPLVESTNSTIANLVSEKTMMDMPLNGRSFTDLTALAPGVVTNLGVTESVFTGGGRAVINGARPQQSLYLLDGVDIVSPYENLAPVSVMNQTLGVDAIREFSVLQSNYGAQYGRAIGGVVNAVSRSGTNAFHGGAFEYLRNSVLDAKNFFDSPALPIPPFKRNQFGGSVGGPVVKDHTFFFFSYEGLRERLGVTDFGTVLSDEARAGQITGCPPGRPAPCSKDQRIITQTVTVNPDIVPLINLLPRGNGRYLNDGIQEFLGSKTQPGGENFYMARMDQQLSQKDSFFGRITVDNSHAALPDAQLLPDGTHPSFNSKGFYTYSTLEWTRIFSPSVLNVARFGFVRNNNGTCQCLPGTNTDVQKFPGLPPQLQIGPGWPFGGPYTIQAVAIPGGVGSDSIMGTPLSFIDNTFDYSDSVRITKGRHSLDLGMNIKRYQENEGNNVWAGGQTQWLAPTANFLTGGTCSGCGGISQIVATGVTHPPDSYRGWRQTYGSMYIQDDFKLRSNLTLNLGLRWERVTPPVEVNGKAATFKDVLHDTQWTQLGKHGLFQLRDGWKDFAPRVGFAYSLNPTTAFRGGFGVFKEMPLEYLWQLAIYYPPYAERVTLRNLRRWPNPL